MTQPDSRKALRLPAGRLYWALLDADALTGSRAARERALGYLFESEIPVPIEGVHAVYGALPNGRVLACGIDRSRLDEIVAGRPDSLRGDRVPARLGVEGEPPEPPELLVGEHEPRSARRGRARRAIVAAAAIGCCALALLAGQLRRAAFLDRESARYAEATGTLYRAVLPPTISTAPDPARLIAELRSLERTRDPAGTGGDARDASTTLATLLAAWPSGLILTTQSLAVSPTVITLHALLPDEADAERFERELRAPDGWRLAQPSVQRERGGISVRVRIEPEAAQ